MMLSKEQTEIIDSYESRVQVLAVAGSGKTITLCERVRELVRRGVAKDKIVILSHSNAAIDVLRARLGDMVKMKTIHSFANEVLRYSGKRYTLISDAGRKKVIADVVAEAVPNIGSLKGVEFKSVVDAFSTLLLQRGAHNISGSICTVLGIEAQDLPALTGKIKKYYRKEKRKRHLLDYDDIPTLAEKTLSAGQSGGVSYTHLLVDEYQDMNHSQAALLVVLAEIIPNIMVFGDSMQSINGFAEQEFHDLAVMVDDVTTLRLTQSFRLTRQTAALVTAVLASAAGENGDGRIRSSRDGLLPVYQEFTSQALQEEFIGEQITRLLASGVAPDDIVVLGRTRNVAREIERALRARDIDARPIDEVTSNVHIKCVLKLMVLAEKYIQLGFACFSQNRKAVMREMAAILGAFLDGDKAAECWRKLRGLIKNPSALQGVYSMACKIYLYHKGQEFGDAKNQIRKELDRYLPICMGFSCTTDLRQQINMLWSRPPVAISTIHGSKGKEWKYVFIANVVDGCIPFFRSGSADGIEEERRILYVAISRAIDRVFILRAPYESHIARERFDQLSRFLTPGVQKKYTTATPH